MHTCMLGTVNMHVTCTRFRVGGHPGEESSQTIMCCKKQGFVNSRSHYLFIQHYIFQLVDDQLLLSATSKLVSNLDKNGVDKATVYAVFSRV